MRFLLAILLIFAITVPVATATGTDSFPPQPILAPPTFAQSQVMNYVLGDRSRMLQVTTIGFGIGLVILLTATRKR